MKIIEATLILPMTVLIVISMLSIMMSYYGEIETQITSHSQTREEMYKTSDFTKVRIYETVKQFTE